MSGKIKKSDIKLECTCGACPEQYNATLNGEVVGYLRLRHGCFTVHYLHASGEQIYSACPIGDGIFEHNERDGYLRKAVKAIVKKLREENYG